ncbi:MAG: regulatory protein RecX [Deltaproteobacteria bacterium]|nr:regulatory protein RecX [Deltaproteobacteria bacterium]
MTSISNASEGERARNTACRFLSYCARSTFQVEKKLKERGFAEEVVSETIDRLKELGFLDDASFAESFARDLALVKGFGRFQIEKRLKDKGIEGEALTRAIERVFSEIDEFEAARRLALKKTKGHLNSVRDKAKIGRYLYGRGYSWDIITEILKGLDDRKRDQE